MWTESELALGCLIANISSFFIENTGIYRRSYFLDLNLIIFLAASSLCFIFSFNNFQLKALFVLRGKLEAHYFSNFRFIIKLNSDYI